jgi:hypothetical protein
LRALLAEKIGIEEAGEKYAKRDIHWKTSKRELLINIPASKEEPAGYYGCGSLQDAIKGRLDTQLPNEWILLWLTR